MNKRYKVSIIEFETGEDDTLKAQALYEQTVEALNIRKVIEAVNADAPFDILPMAALRKPRSDKGKRRTPSPADYLPVPTTK